MIEFGVSCAYDVFANQDLESFLFEVKKTK